MSELNLRTDDELVLLFSNGSNEAFDTLIERYDAEVLSYIRSSVSDWDDANDIFQEIFIKVINTLKSGRYQPHGKFKPWLMRVSHNMVMDYFRKQKSKKTISMYDDSFREDFFDRIPCPSLNIEELLSKENTCQEVRSWVALLPKAQRDVLILRFLKDMSFKEIAEETGVSINTALGRMRYALINLKKIANKDEVFCR